MEEIIVRQLRVKDLEKGFLETLDRLIPIGGLSIKKAKHIFRKITLNPVYWTIVAEKNNMVVGTATVLFQQEFFGNGTFMAHVENVVVHEKCSGQGIATMLMQAVDQEIRKRNCFRVVLNCSDDNISFYEKLGYERKGNEMRIVLKHFPRE
ncbi:MAG: GNAT family N-acetyltransferase [Candidatus Nealsonbacteria bacterium]|nr:GNAT family N-acetyltransferase [Candidatus Nealsonbacteria bacterium]